MRKKIEKTTDEQTTIATIHNILKTYITTTTSCRHFPSTCDKSLGQTKNYTRAIQHQGLEALTGIHVQKTMRYFKKKVKKQCCELRHQIWLADSRQSIGELAYGVSIDDEEYHEFELLWSSKIEKNWDRRGGGNRLKEKIKIRQWSGREANCR